MATITSAPRRSSKPPGTSCSKGLPTTGDAGFLLGVSDNKLLLDGIPLETGNAERSFATLLTTAGLASLHFSKDVTEEDFVRLVRAFTVAGSKAQDVAKQIKEALGRGQSRQRHHQDQ